MLQYRTVQASRPGHTVVLVVSPCPCCCLLTASRTIVVPWTLCVLMVTGSMAAVALASDIDVAERTPLSEANAAAVASFFEVERQVS